eukprot:2354078-Pyramimonas_sp.AAC.1
MCPDTQAWLYAQLRGRYTLRIAICSQSMKPRGRLCDGVQPQPHRGTELSSGPALVCVHHRAR